MLLMLHETSDFCQSFDTILRNLNYVHLFKYNPPSLIK